jgi:hypothetical protein
MPDLTGMDILKVLGLIPLVAIGSFAIGIGVALVGALVCVISVVY